jgi:hypothetical protein
MYLIKDNSTGHYAEGKTEADGMVMPSGNFSSDPADGVGFPTSKSAERFLAALRSMYGPSARFELIDEFEAEALWESAQYS